MLGIFTDDHDFSLALDYLAFVANFLDRRSDFHLLLPPIRYPAYLERQVISPLVRS